MGIQYILEIIGTFAFAISGTLTVKDREYGDWFAACFTAFLSAIGGGTLRDVLLGSYPLVWVADIRFLHAILAGIIITFLFYRYLIEFKRTLFLFDTFGIALFTIVGTEKALSLGVRPEIAAIMGVFSAVMGGAIRDVMTNEMPIVYRSEVYATPCFIGAVTYLTLDYGGAGRDFSFLASAAVIILIRILAVRYHWTVPKFFR